MVEQSLCDEIYKSWRAPYKKEKRTLNFNLVQTLDNYESCGLYVLDSSKNYEDFTQRVVEWYCKNFEHFVSDYRRIANSFVKSNKNVFTFLYDKHLDKESPLYNDRLHSVVTFSLIMPQAFNDKWEDCLYTGTECLDAYLNRHNLVVCKDCSDETYSYCIGPEHGPMTGNLYKGFKTAELAAKYVCGELLREKISRDYIYTELSTAYYPYEIDIVLGMGHDLGIIDDTQETSYRELHEKISNEVAQEIDAEDAEYEYSEGLEKE